MWVGSDRGFPVRFWVNRLQNSFWIVFPVVQLGSTCVTGWVSGVGLQVVLLGIGIGFESSRVRVGSGLHMF